jgi:hypothetical protein
MHPQQRLLHVEVDQHHTQFFPHARIISRGDEAYREVSAASAPVPDKSPAN